ncbi:MAG: Aspartyl/glutamyl-tRNA(Asn/Gln) amidotransferase subunit B [candidate division WWE3 bacterium GW2011_GWD1_42_70]|nr:MAG: Aspartyl/glutamyl-tRNA(Asn/Gln) amidotransferase subunit B [candidate division WWE3 bacterium GW2011_GWD1_42_70]
MNEELLGKYKLVVGMEVHIQPKTEQKMFCGCDANIWGAEPNTHTCPTCLGLPGALPVPNLEGVKKAQMLGLALNCTLNSDSRFDRKHYFYPDLPKGYQISQYKQPLCENGKLLLESGDTADIERVHLEEDVAKSFHEGGKTLVDFNKSGLPLIEVVTRPCFRSIEDAVDYCKKLQVICRYLGISEADMEKGQMRLEANISLRTGEMEEKDELSPYKVEVKNMNLKILRLRKEIKKKPLITDIFPSPTYRRWFLMRNTLMS